MFFPFTYSVSIMREYIQTQKSNKTLETQVEELFEDNLILKNSLEFIAGQMNIQDIEQTDSLITSAQVISFTSTFKDKNIIIDKGSTSGVQQDFTAITKAGLVGKIISTNDNSSVVLPITNSLFKAAVMNKRSRVQGVLEPSVYSEVFVSLVGVDHDIELGDTIVTSNISTLFKTGVPVGRVLSLSYSNQKNRILVQIEPFVNFNYLERVFILPKKSIL